MTLSFHVVEWPENGKYDVIERNVVTGDWRVVRICRSKEDAEQEATLRRQRECDLLLARAKASGR